MKIWFKREFQIQDFAFWVKALLILAIRILDFDHSVGLGITFFINILSWIFFLEYKFIEFKVIPENFIFPRQDKATKIFLPFLTIYTAQEKFWTASHNLISLWMDVSVSQKSNNIIWNNGWKATQANARNSHMKTKILLNDVIYR